MATRNQQSIEKPRTKVRLRTVEVPPPWGDYEAMPMLARECVKKLNSLFPGPLLVTVDRSPPSLNGQYVRRRRGQSFGLAEGVKEFRDEMFLRLGHQRSTWNKGGLLAAVVVFHSPSWLTKELTVRNMDADNKVKAVFDAFEKATGIQDNRIWEHHVFKSYAEKERTTLWVFDMGDIVTKLVFTEGEREGSK